MGDSKIENLVLRLKTGKLCYADFIKESERLPLEELQTLSELLSVTLPRRPSGAGASQTAHQKDT
jgi:hypothetical protein